MIPRLFLILLLLATPASCRGLTVRLFSTQTVKRLTTQQLTMEWMPDGLHLPTRTVKQLSLSGTLRLQANGGPEAKATGQWSIAWRADGIRVLLTLPEEEYVIAALNGEAAPDEPAASLKALAVTIRTFAVANSGRHRAQGFDLCDSTHCQSLRLGVARPAVVRAVRETAGETLWFGGRHAHVYYTEHCGGRREAAADVWPAEQARYLQGQQADPYCLRRSPAAWQAHLPLAQISGILRAQGWKTPFPIENIRVQSRSPSGRVQRLQVSGRGAPAELSANSFRFAVDRALGWNQIRSDWYSLSVSNGSLVLNGKGYGHGAGLCQAGAYEMAREGRSQQDILNFYFPGVTAGVTTADRGWQTVAGAGWTLLTTHPDGSLVAEGNAAWAKAQALFGSPAVAIHPIVQDLPTTELFRQTTAEPGWVLASTRGRTIFLQPVAIRQANGSTEELFLHEFLHALVEQEAGNRTPLWLREGLVETLANKGKTRHEVVEAMPADLLEAELRHPTSALASRHAHEVAAHMANQLCARYGLPAVRGFLRTGVPTALPTRAASVHSWLSMHIDSEQFRVLPGGEFSLASRKTMVKPFYESKKQYQHLLQDHVAKLSELQELHYASSRYALLLILQGMDSAGKDGIIRHVMSGINPAGCEVSSFKQPSAEELQHDFLWRTNCRLPERGRIGIFNRSYYEEVLVVRVHPEMLHNQKLPEELMDEKDIWKQRYRSILELEGHLYRNGTRTVKFFLHLSQAEQKKRFLARIDEPGKNWKFSLADIHERKYWKQYTAAYQACLNATSTHEAPWYVVPADDKMNARLIVARIIVDAMSSLKLAYPKTTAKRRHELQAIGKQLKKS